MPRLRSPSLAALVSLGALALAGQERAEYSRTPALKISVRPLVSFLSRYGSYRVPTCVEERKRKLGFDSHWLEARYRESSARLGLSPREPYLAFQDNPSRALGLVSLAKLGAIEGDALERATVDFFRQLGRELAGRGQVETEFRRLFQRGETYITSGYSFALDQARASVGPFSEVALARAVSALASYRRAIGKADLYPELFWEEPHLALYFTDYIRRSQPGAYLEMIEQLAERDPEQVAKLRAVMRGYAAAEVWMAEAIEFFKSEPWFRDPESGTYSSIDDLLRRFWSSHGVELRPTRARVIAIGRVDAFGRARTDLGWLEEAMKGADEESQRFLDRLSPPEKYALLRRLRVDPARLPSPAAGRLDVLSLSAFLPQGLEASHQQYDLGNRLISVLASIAHEVTHSILGELVPRWKVRRLGDREALYFAMDEYVHEGMAELSDQLIMALVYRRFPVIGHETWWRFYIFDRLKPLDYHQLGYFWMATAHDLNGGDFAKTMALARRAYGNLEELLADEELVEAAGGCGGEPLTYPREQGGPIRHAVFPGAVFSLWGGETRLEELYPLSEFPSPP